MMLVPFRDVAGQYDLLPCEFTPRFLWHILWICSSLEIFSLKGRMCDILLWVSFCDGEGDKD